MKITVFPRIHFTLISMDAAGWRRNGGVGVAINNPQLTIVGEPAPSVSVRDNRDKPFSGDAITAIEHVLKSAIVDFGLKSAISVAIRGGLVAHSGFGSGTAIRLACLELLFGLNDSPIDRSTLVRLSRRGGTSGVGINTYFDGGYLYDFGQKNSSSPWMPSAKVVPSGPPPSISIKSFPDWPLGLLLPDQISARTQEEEVKFFQENAPIRTSESHAAAYYSFMGVHASVLAGDYQGFCWGIRRLQSCGFKVLERAQYGKALQDIEEELYQLGADCVGLSSMGPSLYFFANVEVLNNIEQNAKELGGRVIKTKVRNEGRLFSGERCWI